VRIRFAIFVACFSAACGARPEPAVTEGRTAPSSPAASSSSLDPAAPVRPKPAESTSPKVAERLAFTEDDYVAARAQAKERGLPLFVDVWASWCHTCMSMKEVVLPDPALLGLKDAFVWLSIDSENTDNAAFLDRFPAKSLPTLWVIDAKSEAPIFKWIGVATAEELRALLEDAGTSGKAAAKPGGDATVLWIQGNRASAEGHAEQAVNLYRQALRAGSTEWPRRAKALEALSTSLRELGRTRDAVELATKEVAAMPPGTSRVNVLLNGIDAAAALPPTKASLATLASLSKLGTKIAEDATEPILVDDRSGLYLALVNVVRPSDASEAKRLALEWVAMLEGEAKRAPPEKRRVWDSHRLEAYLALGEPERAIPMLEQSEREVPNDYNPPARLARAHLALGKLDAAESAVSRALVRSNGPRKIRLYMLKADILLAEKNVTGARAALKEALDFAQKEKLAAQYAGLRQVIEQRLRATR
jgi:tetratricopeptide (TPR) repeat protein